MSAAELHCFLRSRLADPLNSCIFELRSSAEAEAQDDDPAEDDPAIGMIVAAFTHTPALGLWFAFFTPVSIFDFQSPAPRFMLTFLRMLAPTALAGPAVAPCTIHAFGFDPNTDPNHGPGAGSSSSVSSRQEPIA